MRQYPSVADLSQYAALTMLEQADALVAEAGSQTLTKPATGIIIFSTAC